MDAANRQPFGRRTAPVLGFLFLAGCATMPNSPAPGALFRDCPDCPELTVVPAGRFLMGSRPDEVGRFEDEGPVHEVIIARPLAVMRAGDRGPIRTIRTHYPLYSHGRLQRLGRERRLAEGCGSKLARPRVHPAERPSGRLHLVERRTGIRQVALCTNWSDVPLSHRVRIRVCRPRWRNDGFPVGQQRREVLRLCQRFRSQRGTRTS